MQIQDKEVLAVVGMRLRTQLSNLGGGCVKLRWPGNDFQMLFSSPKPDQSFFLNQALNILSGIEFF